MVHGYIYKGWINGWIDIDISVNELKYDSFEYPKQ